MRYPLRYERNCIACSQNEVAEHTFEHRYLGCHDRRHCSRLQIFVMGVRRLVNHLDGLDLTVILDQRIVVCSRYNAIKLDLLVDRMEDAFVRAIFDAVIPSSVRSVAPQRASTLDDPCFVL